MCRRRLDGFLHDHERVSGTKETLDQYTAKRVEEQVDGGMPKKARVGDGIGGASGEPMVTPDSEDGPGGKPRSCERGIVE